MSTVIAVEYSIVFPASQTQHRTCMECTNNEGHEKILIRLQTLGHEEILGCRLIATVQILSLTGSLQWH